jgi:hypothetical protein
VAQIPLVVIVVVRLDGCLGKCEEWHGFFLLDVDMVTRLLHHEQTY